MSLDTLRTAVSWNPNKVPLLTTTTTTSSLQMQLSLVKRAMELTKDGASNITSAYAAVDAWEQALGPFLFDNNNPHSILDRVRATSYALQAASLVRIGQDDRALAVYDKALALNAYLTDDTARDVRMGKAKSLQRLLRYRQSKAQFLQIPFTASAAIGGATCDMRLGDLNGAIQTLEHHVFDNLQQHQQQQQGNITTDLNVFQEAQCMLETLRCLRSPGQDEQRDLSMILTKQNDAGSPVSPLHKLIYTALKMSNNIHWSKSTFLDYCQVNNGAFDDPLLLHLDDKVLLHQLLASSAEETEHYWPQGVILSVLQIARLLLSSTEVDGTTTPGAVHPWIGKRRSGYGSHGNTIVYTRLERIRATAGKNTDSSECTGCDDSILMQRMVEPPLLLNGYKFSLRVYVVAFGAMSALLKPDLYISETGLVKIASVPLEQPTLVEGGRILNETNLRMHMTNSGRESVMRQESFHYIRQELSPDIFGDIWSSVVQAVGSVMQLYETRAPHLLVGTARETATHRLKLATLGIPKILGFDFVVDASRNAWLVEVNRFPGLEPRNEMDATVKHQIIFDAWRIAAKRCNDDAKRKIMLSLIESDFADLASANKEFLLKRLDCFRED